jgi:hypothetical protein
MERMEQLIRESLEARAHDVEPTPALWLEVDRRVARRRRFQVVSWSLAGVTAVLAAVLAVPAIVGLFTGPDTIEIPPLDRTPAAGVVSTHVVAIDAEGTARLVDLRTDESIRDLVELGFVPSGLAVSPTSTPDAVEFAAIAATGELTVVGADGQTWYSGDVDAPDGFAWSVVAAPNGRWFATTSPMEEADGATVTVARPVSSWVPGEDVTWTEIGMVVDQGSRLVAWTGAVADEGDRSQLWLITADGRLVQETLEVTDGVPRSLEVGSSELDAVLDAATSSAQGGRIGEPFYVLRDVGAGPELVWFGADGVASEHVPLADHLGDADPAALWLDAKQDGALVGDGERTWLVAHDGRGAFAEPIALADGFVRAAMLDVVRPGGGATDDPTDDPTEAPTEEPTSAPTDPDTAEPEGPVVEGAPLPAPIVTVSARELTLHGPDGPQVIAELAVEGESRFISARVRPGSTTDDLTVVALTTAEGMWDLRTIRWVDGEQTVFEAFPEPHIPGWGGSAGAGSVPHGPVWSPQGDHLAWFEFGTGPATLRTVGWDDGPGTGDPATDNASFELDTRGQVPLIPVEWVAMSGGPSATEIRAVALDSNEGWYALPVDIQGDGAIALSGSGFRTEPGDGTDLVVGLADDGRGEVRWLLQLTFDGPVLVDAAGPQEGRRTELPTEVMPGDGLTQLSMRPIGDGVLVASPHTGAGYYVTADGEANRLPGEVFDADVIRPAP